MESGELSGVFSQPQYRKLADDHGLPFWKGAGAKFSKGVEGSDEKLAFVLKKTLYTSRFVRVILAQGPC
eukprot:536013-Amphidinium_carterae.1